MRSKNIGYSEKLDHIRCFAAIFVILFHCLVLFTGNNLVTAKDIQDSPLARLAAHGDSAVALFMTLSGFLFALICSDKNINLWGFYRNRILRIYPLFLFILLLACSLDPRHNDFGSLLRSIFFMHNLPNAVFYKQFTEILWTVPVEFQFYLVFPFLLIFYRKFGLKYLCMLIALSLGIKTAAYYLTGSVSIMAYETIFGRIDQFVVGMILGLSYEKLKSRFVSPLLFITLLAATVCLFISVPSAVHETSDGPFWIVRNLIEGVIWGVLIVSYLSTSFALPPLISRVIAFGGALSFSMYVNHFFLLRLYQIYFPLVYSSHSRYPYLCQIGEWLRAHPIASCFSFTWGWELPVTVVASVLTYFVIEKPFLSLRSQYIIKPENFAGDEMPVAVQPTTSVSTVPGQSLSSGAAHPNDLTLVK